MTAEEKEMILEVVSKKELLELVIDILDVDGYCVTIMPKGYTVTGVAPTLERCGDRCPNCGAPEAQRHRDGCTRVIERQRLI